MNNFGHPPSAFPDEEGVTLDQKEYFSLVVNGMVNSMVNSMVPAFVVIMMLEDFSNRSLNSENSWDVSLKGVAGRVFIGLLMFLVFSISDFMQEWMVMRERLNLHLDAPDSFDVLQDQLDHHNNRAFERTDSWSFWTSISPDFQGYQYINHNEKVNFPGIIVRRYSEDLHSLAIDCRRANAGAYVVLSMCLLSGLKEVEQVHFAESLDQGVRRVTIECSPENMFICLNNIITVLNNIEKSISKVMADYMFSFLTSSLATKAKASYKAYDATQNQRALDFLQGMFPDVLAPAELSCSITQALMTRVVSYKNDGVTNSFEESAILEWLSRNSTDPLTRNRLAFFMLSRDGQKERDINEFLYQPELMNKVAGRFLFNSLSKTLNDGQRVRDARSASYFFKGPKADSNDLERKPSMLLLTNG